MRSFQIPKKYLKQYATDFDSGKLTDIWFLMMASLLLPVFLIPEKKEKELTFDFTNT